MALSTYLADALLNWHRGTAFPAAPVTIYLSLHTAHPGGTGTNELPVANGYARIAVALDAPADYSDGRMSDNTDLETFTAAGGDWGLVTHVGFWDASTGGNFLDSGPTVNADIKDGDTYKWEAGNLRMVGH